jgi:hypothetical protein
MGLLSLVWSLGVLGATAGLQTGQPDAAQVSWAAPVGCPNRSAVVAGVEALLGRPLDSKRVAIRAAGEVERIEDQRWLLRLTTRSPTGERERVLEGTTCQELAEVAIVLVAIAIDPSVEVPQGPGDLVEASSQDSDPGDDRVEEPPTAERDAVDEGLESHETPELPPAAEPEPAEPAALPEEDPVSADDGARRVLQGSASVATGLLVGPLPGVAPGVRVSGGLRWRSFGVALGGSHWFERKVRLPPAEVVGGDLHLTTADLRLCAVPSVRRLELPLCTGAEIGALAGRGVGVSNPQRRRALWAAWVADVGVTFMPWPWVGFGARTVLVVPLTRSTFELDGVGTVHAVGTIGFQALAGIEFRFP